MKRVRVIPDKCTGCRICESICGFMKHQEFNPKRSRIRIVKMDRILLDVPMLCRQCANAPCIKSCPENALRRDERTGALRVESNLCIGCEICIEACPFGAIFLDPVAKVAIACDLCEGEPACVTWCPTGALDYANESSVSQKRRWDKAMSVSRPLLKKWMIPVSEYEKCYGEAGPVARRKASVCNDR